jgi:gluconolactonase
MTPEIRLPASARWDRRAYLTTVLGAGTAARLGAQGRGAPPAAPAAPAPRSWSPLDPTPYPDPDIEATDPRFRRYILFNTSIRRLHVGTSWAEGPAWNGVGRYLVWSDIPSIVQLRWLEDDGRVTTFRNPAGFSNGNTFDYEGRQLSCEHGGRRVARYEPNGTVTTIADRFDGKRLNSPNDVVVAPDGGIWFTDPTYGIRGNYEGVKAESETKEAVYRADGRTGQIARVTDEVNQPNGLCFSPDYRRLYVSDTGAGEIKVWDVDGGAIRNGRRFAGTGADGIQGAGSQQIRQAQSAEPQAADLQELPPGEPLAQAIGFWIRDGQHRWTPEMPRAAGSIKSKFNYAKWERFRPERVIVSVQSRSSNEITRRLPKASA